MNSYGAREQTSGVWGARGPSVSAVLCPLRQGRSVSAGTWIADAPVFQENSLQKPVRASFGFRTCAAVYTHTHCNKEKKESLLFFANYTLHH